MSSPTDELLDEEFKIISDFLKSASTTFVNLLRVQDEVWKCLKADAYFKVQKERAVVDVSDEQKKGFYLMMTKIGDQLQMKEKLIPPVSKRMNFDVLDLCMAPGGFTATVLKNNRFAQVCAISLPRSEGGLEIYLPNWKENKRVKVELVDLNILSTELGFPNLASQDHPSASKFSSNRPFPGRKFDLIFCDGHILPSPIAGKEEMDQARRLSDAQIIMALQRIKPAGTLVMLLHHSYSPRVLRLLEAFYNFSQVTIFKPPKVHAKRTSFYLVAKNVEPQHERVRRLIREMRYSWRLLTTYIFGVKIPEIPNEENDTEEAIEVILQSFGTTFVALAEPAWKIQTEAMESAFLGRKN
ncbi:hypothetical protein N7490_002775 [Penicillium lividum]|nr:hypothetical protein N7490_002775 [Penicillium lividum]